MYAAATIPSATTGGASGTQLREKVAIPYALDLPHVHQKESRMILEIADIRIHPGQQAAFEEAIQRGASAVIGQAEGMRGWKVNKCIETPERYVLQIFWDSLEDHTVKFRGSPLFAQWRAIVGPFFAQPPLVEHFTLFAKSDSVNS